MLAVWVVMCQRRLDIYNRPLSLKLITSGVLKLLTFFNPFHARMKPWIFIWKVVPLSLMFCSFGKSMTVVTLISHVQLCLASSDFVFMCWVACHEQMMYTNVG